MAERLFSARIARDNKGTMAVSLVWDFRFVIPDKDDLDKDPMLTKVYIREETSGFDQLYWLNKLPVPEEDFRTTIVTAPAYTNGHIINIPIKDIDTEARYLIEVNNIVPIEICERYYTNPDENVICIPGIIKNAAGETLQAAGIISRITTISEIVDTLFDQIVEASNNIEKIRRN